MDINPNVKVIDITPVEAPEVPASAGKAIPPFDQPQEPQRDTDGKIEIDEMPTIEHEMKDGRPEIKYKQGMAMTEEEYIDWLKKEISLPTKQNKKGNRIELKGNRIDKMEFNFGSVGLIFKGKTLVRQSPFIWQQNIETKHCWAVFKLGDFYGFNPSMKIWKRMKNRVVLIPFDKSEWSCWYTPSGYTARFDEASLSQFPVNAYITEKEMKNRVEDTQFASEYITLMTMLEKYTKAKWNWKLIVIIIAIAVLAGVSIWYIQGHPHLLQGLSQQLGLGHL